MVELDTGQVNDIYALASIAIQTKKLSGVMHMKVLADKRYHTGEELEQCQKNNIITFVSPKAPSTKDQGLYPVTSFIYDKENDLYICPQDHRMTTNGTWLKHSDKRKTAKEHTSLKDIIQQPVKIVKQDIDVPKAKPMEDTLIVAGMLKLFKQMHNG